MDQKLSRVAVLALGTAIPNYQFQQAELGQWMSEAFGDQPALRRQIKHLYAVSGIETRYSCLPDPLNPPSESRFSPTCALVNAPTTSERMAIYQQEAVALGTAAARNALADYGDLAATSATVTHLIVVSCTGFFAPGLDQAIATQLHLPPTVERVLIGFMGCAAAFNGLRLARQIVNAQPHARVLVVCVEICSIHIQPGSSRVHLVVGSLFADGAAACLVGAPAAAQHDYFTLDDFYTEIAPDTEQEMVWQIGEHGFTLHLSPALPRRVGDMALRAFQTLMGTARPQFWAIHPGGRAIVDRLTMLFNLTATQVAPSLAVLRDYGNMSSPTILFVLREQRERLRHTPDATMYTGVAMAFGPGLVVEMARLSYQPLDRLLPMRKERTAQTAGAYVA